MEPPELRWAVEQALARMEAAVQRCGLRDIIELQERMRAVLQLAKALERIEALEKQLNEKSAQP